MKCTSSRTWYLPLFSALALVLFVACDAQSDLTGANAPNNASVDAPGAPSSVAASGVVSETVVATGLSAPVGVEFVLRLGGLVVAEGGTGADDGRVTLIRGDSTFVLVDNLPSNRRPDGNVEGTTHVATSRGDLWIVNGFSGLLYRYDLSLFSPSSPAVDASTLPTEDLRNFIFAEGFTDSNIYDIVFDLFGNAYVTDSGANIVVKRTSGGALSVFTVIPEIANPAPIGPPSVEAVPTGLAFNGRSFAVTAFGGFPFAPGSSQIFTLGRFGSIVDATDGFTGLIEAEYSQPFRRSLFVLQLGTFGEFGFTPNTGALLEVTSSGGTVRIDGLNLPNGLEVIDLGDTKKVFVTSIADGTVTKYVLSDNVSS